MKTLFKKVPPILGCMLLIFFGGMIIARPDRYLLVCFDGICMWAECVLPSLFPFMVITLLLIKSGAVECAAKPFARLSKKLKLPSVTLPLLLMSVCSGYPAGSRILCEYYECGLITKGDCKRLAPMLSTCGPLFALGTIGAKAFNDGAAGVKLLCASLVAVLGTSLIYCLIPRKSVAKHLPCAGALKRGDALYDSFYGGVVSCAVAGGFICFFYTLSQVLCDAGAFAPFIKLLAPLLGENSSSALFKGLIEATGGCFSLAAEGGFFALPLCGFLVVFGGASIIAQQSGYLKKCGVSAGFFTLFKFVQGLVAFALLCLFSVF